GGPDLRFIDQRTFGHLLFSVGGAELPSVIAHIAPDPLEAAFDRAAFASRLHWARASDRLRGPDVTRLVDAVLEVFGEALGAGGTSFDSLYVNVNGES